MRSVDVFVVVHNHARTLRATLSSLAGQSLGPQHVVVVDNRSTDSSVGIVEEIASTLPLELVRLAENRGFAAAANEAIRRTRAEWLLALNPDCRLDPGFLATLLEAAGNRSGTGAAGGLLLRARGASLEASELVDSAGMVVTSAGRHLDRGAGCALHAGWLRPAWMFGASGAAALYRREALDDVAYPAGEVFDEGFFAYREDADLAWRLQRRGWHCLYWPEARAWHARGLKPEEARRGTPEINRHSVRNRFLLRWSNADWRWRLACFPGWFLRDLAVGLACLTVERGSLPGLAEARELRRQQLARGRANAERASVSGWKMARWFLPGGRARRLEG